MMPAKPGSLCYMISVLVLGFTIDFACMFAAVEEPWILSHFNVGVEDYAFVSAVWPLLACALFVVTPIAREFVSSERLLSGTAITIATCTILVVISIAVRSFTLFLIFFNIGTAM